MATSTVNILIICVTLIIITAIGAGRGKKGD